MIERDDRWTKYDPVKGEWVEVFDIDLKRKDIEMMDAFYAKVKNEQRKTNG